MNTSTPWVSAVGAWGDTICACGQITKLLKDTGEEKANIVFFGLDQNICELLKVQPFIGKVEWLKCDPPSVAGRYIQMANEKPDEWYKLTELDKLVPDLQFTHIFGEECQRNFDLVLPPAHLDWVAEPHDPYVLFQPYSTQSCTYEEHWPHWRDALRLVLDTADLDVVIVGETLQNIEQWYNLDLLEHPRVTCLIGQTKSMIDVLHIASKAKAYVGTCNALAYWSLLKHIPATVVCNSVIKKATPYYYKWLKFDSNWLLDYEASMDEFIESIDLNINGVANCC